MLKKVHIENYRVFRSLTLEFNEGLNVLVGNNDAGKSTLLEAVHLALTSRIRGRPLETELSPFLFNQETATQYVMGIQAGHATLPEIVIELYLSRSLKRTRCSRAATTVALRTRAGCA